MKRKLRKVRHNIDLLEKIHNKNIKYISPFERWILLPQAMASTEAVALTIATRALRIPFLKKSQSTLYFGGI